MNTTKHTPGPWHVVTIDQSIGSVEASDGSAVAQAQIRGTLRNPNHEERRANARMMAASPELLEVLCELVEIERRDRLTDPDMVVTDEHRKRTCEKATTIISKAKGTTP